MRIFLTALLAAALASPLTAQEYRPSAPVPALDWSGFYIGANAGYAQGVNESGFRGWVGGGQAGYNLQNGPFVLGIIADAQGTGLSIARTVSTNLGFFKDSDARTTSSDFFATFRAKVGFGIGPVFVYGTGGVALADIKVSRSEIATFSFPPFPSTTTTTQGSNSQWHTGYTAGGGAEYRIDQNWSVFGEYLYNHFEDKQHDLGNAGIVTVGGDIHLARGGVNFRF